MKTINQIPAGVFCGDEKLPTGTFRGDEKLPKGTFRFGN